MNEPTSLCEWIRVSDLGAGSFGVVQLWTHRITHEQVAIKKCRFQQDACITPKQRERWTLEVEFMQRVNHPNIVAFKQLPNDFRTELEKYNYSRLPLLAMEYCTGGNLRAMLRKDRNICGFREQEVRKVLEDIANAVDHLHRQGITHRDIKPENVVVHLSTGPRVTYKLIDLGYAKDMNALVSYVGTVAYTAPEIFRNEEYNHNVDYWSFGIMAYELCCGKYPFMVEANAMDRFNLLAKKPPRDICIYKSAGNKIISTDKIMEPNYISPCLRTYLEDWLGSMLQYDKTHRGVTKYGTNVFSVLKTILNKQILHVFVVYNVTHYHYEVNAATKLERLQILISQSTGLAPTDQLLLATSTSIPRAEFYTRLNEPGCKVTDLGLLPQSILLVLKRGQFILKERLVFPPVVKSVLNNNTNDRPWALRRMELSHVVHYIEIETTKMQIIRMVVHEIFGFLRCLVEEQGTLIPILHETGKQALQLVEFCRRINSGCAYDGSKIQAIQEEQTQLRKVKELIENTNAASARYLMDCRKLNSVKASYNNVVQFMENLKFDDFIDEALDFLKIEKSKAHISSLICKYAKTRCDLHGQPLTDYFTICFKVLREYEKLTRWIMALISNLKTVSEELLECQRKLSCSNVQPNDASSIGSVVTLNGLPELGCNNDDNDDGVDAVHDLVYVNRMLRSKLRESLESLLSMHQSHAISIGEFVHFMDEVDVDLGNDLLDCDDSHSTAV